MAKTSTPTYTAPNATNDSDVLEYQELWRGGYDALEAIRSTWDEKEMLLLSKNPDKISKTTKSQVNDGRLSTIIFERASRVMAQLPSGSYHALTEANRGMAELMHLMMERYVIPNARNPQDHLTKFRMLDLYSMVYGSMPILYDWQVTDGYTGPNSWILPLRNVVFEPGKFTIPESNWVAVSSMVSVRWLKSQRQGESAWNREAVQYVLGMAEECGGKNPSLADEGRRSYVERNRLPTTSGTSGENALIEIITFYESGKDGHWITFCPDFDFVRLRDIPNPHGNGKIPIILKHCFPLIDSMIGLGDVERGVTLQKAMNSLINLYLDAVKFSIFPPVKVVREQLNNSASIIWEPGQKWEVKNQAAAELLQISPGGMQTFQSTYGFMISALLNQNGTTDTARSQEIDPGMGKTPQALAMQANRESSRDNWDRYMMETVVEDTYNAYLDLIVRKQEKPVKLYLFKDEIVNLRKNYPEDEYLERYTRSVYDDFQLNQDGAGGMATIRKDMIKGPKGAEVEYKFFVDASSTQKREQQMENEAIGNILMLALKAGGPQIFPNVDFGKLMEKYIKTSGIADAEEAILDEQEMQERQQQAQQQQQIDPLTGQPMASMGPPPTDTNGNPAFPGINAPTGSPQPAPDMQSLGMTAQDPDVQAAIQRMRGIT